MGITRSQLAVSGLVAYLLLYLSWQLFHWLPGRVQLGQAFLPLADAIALCATLLAARRCAGYPALRKFWLMMSAAVTAQLIADVLLLRNVLVYRDPPFPTLADLFFLAFYVLLFLALLRIPVAPVTRAKRTRLLLDGATIVVGTGAVVWYFVLGPTAKAGGQSPLAMAVSLAYPTGDLILLAGLAVVLLRKSPVILRTPLLLIAVGMAASIVADVVYGYGVLHNTYTNGDPIDTLYVAEFLLFALAAIAQRPIRTQEPVGPDSWSEPTPRASWLPYLSVVIGLAVMTGVEMDNPFIPDVSVVLIVIVLTALVAARQYLAQRELVRTQAALRESERVKNEFLSIAGHELRTPLTSIRGSLGLLEGGVLGELPEDATHMISLALTNTDRLVRLVNDILDIERMAAGKLELEPAPVQADALIAQSLQALQGSADAAEVRLQQVRCEASSMTALADGDRIVQVLVNLVGNAIKFSDPGGVVSVAVEQNAEGALFTVHDRGRGIPASKVDGIFERFQQVDASDSRMKGGTGLGLPIARGIVERHGGRMWVQSREGEGSTFYFTLPVPARVPSSAGAVST
jgi:signal transduction histidine kinase